MALALRSAGGRTDQGVRGLAATTHVGVGPKNKDPSRLGTAKGLDPGSIALAGRPGRLLAAVLTTSQTIRVIYSPLFLGI